METKIPDSPFYRNPLFWGFVVAPVSFCLLCVALAVILYPRDSNEKPEFIRKAEPVVDSRISELDQKVSLLNQNKYKYDIDQTVTALFSIEKTLAEAKNFEELTQFIVHENQGMVAPDVAKLKLKIFNVYKDVLDSKDKIDEIDSIYRTTMTGITDLIGLLGADVKNGGVSLDRDQVKKIWEKRISESKLKDKLQERLRKSQDRLLDILFDYAKLNEKYMKEWNELCAARDRAYLAFYERDWNEMISCAQKAIEISPTETEAHTLLALGLMERGGEVDPGAAKTVIENLLKDNQGQQAPAYLLRGVLLMKEGNYEKAVIDFDQAAAYYPKQQQEVTDKLNLYKKRAFLNKSKEGRVIINTYRGIMSGSGYFSPDFQKARIFLAQNDKIKAKEKTFDHFSRRRQQGQWDKVLTDFQFCSNFLDTDLHEILSGEKVNISIEPAWITNSIIVNVNNHSGKDIHNASILLCVRFTDMFKGDYISFPFGDTAAVISAGKNVKFGKENISDITEETLGTVKKWKDIVEYGAVLISDEIITWIPPVENTRPAPEEEKPQGRKGEGILDKKTTEKAKEVIKNVISEIITNAAEDQAKEKEKKKEKTPSPDPRKEPTK